MIRMKIIGPLSVVTSILLSCLVVLYLWNWLNPIDFWQRLSLLILSLAGGFLLFIVLNIFIAMVFMFIFMLVMRRRFKKTLKKLDKYDKMMYE